MEGESGGALAVGESCLALKESTSAPVGFTIIIRALTTGPRPLPTPSCTSGEIPPQGCPVRPQGPGPHTLVCSLQLHGRLTGHQTRVRALPVSHHHIWGKDPPLWPSASGAPGSCPVLLRSLCCPSDTLSHAGHLPQDPGSPSPWRPSP